MPTIRNGIEETLLGQVSANSPNYLAVAVDFTAAAWNTQATQEVFTVVGLCRLRMWVEVTADCDSAGHAATICFGNALATNSLIAATDETELDNNDLWYDATPTLACDTFALTVFDQVSLDIDYGIEIAGEAMTAGSMLFHCVWEPLGAGASGIAGTGQAMV